MALKCLAVERYRVQQYNWTGHFFTAYVRGNQAEFRRNLVPTIAWSWSSGVFISSVVQQQADCYSTYSNYRRQTRYLTWHTFRRHVLCYFTANIQLYLLLVDRQRIEQPAGPVP